MKRLIMLILLMTALVACGQEENVEENEAPDAEKTEEAESKANEENNAEDEKETNNETENEVTEQKKDKDISKNSEDNEVHKENNSKETNNDNNKEKSEEKNNNKEQNSNNNSVEKPAEKSTEKPEKEPTEKNEKVEVATENIIWAQNDRDYSTLKGYLGQNITLDEKNNLLKITNVDYPHEAELLEGIKKENLEHRFTEEKGNDRIVGFAVTDYETEMSYTIDFTMRVGKDSWKMLNMQINK